MMLCCFHLVVHAAVLDGEFLYLFPAFDDGGVTPEVDIGGRDVADVLVVTVVVVMVDEGADLPFRVSR